MRRIVTRRPSPATLIACLALFVSLGGTGYAAFRLPPNTVGTVQLRPGAVVSSKVRDGSLLARDFKRGQLGAVPATLPSGTTLRGAFFVGGSSAGGNEIATGEISFGLRLAVAPVAHFVVQRASSPPACSGSVTAPQAAPGHLCIYEGGHSQTSIRGFRDPAAIGDFEDPVRRDTGARVRPEGAGLVVYATGGGNFYSVGTWAVTAP